MTNPVGPLVITPPNAVPMPSRKAGMHSVPKVLVSSIFQHLGAKDLQSAEGVCKSWQKFTEDSHVWNPVREKLKISGTKKEVLSYIKDTLSEINKALVGVLPEAFKKEVLSIKHPFNQYVAIESCLRTHLKNNAFKVEVTNNTEKLIYTITRRHPPSTTIRALQVLIDHGVGPLQPHTWGSVIYEINYPRGFEEVSFNNVGEVLTRAIRRNNEAFVQFLLNKMEQSQDWPVVLSSLFFAIAYGDVGNSWDPPRGEINDSVINLIVKALKEVDGIKSIFEAQTKHRFDCIISMTTPAGHYEFMPKNELKDAIAKEKLALERLQKGVPKLRALLFENHEVK